MAAAAASVRRVFRILVVSVLLLAAVLVVVAALLDIIRGAEPDLSAGCSMADMADYDDTLDAWDEIHQTLNKLGWHGRVIPITYVNSTAAIKAFVGANGGACCTSGTNRFCNGVSSSV